MTEVSAAGTFGDMLRRFGLVCAAVAVVLLAAPAYASIVVAYDLERLVGESEDVVSARVVRTSSRYLGPQIVTDVELVVDTVGKGGSRDGQTMSFVTLGGSVDGITMRVEGAAYVAPGDEAVFFIARHESGLRIPVGLSQGVMPIRGRGAARRVHPGGAGLVLMRRDSNGRAVPGAAAIDAPMPVDELIDRVRTIAGGVR